jgi:Zn ribbon nucleic-acid-binding protein
MTEATLWQTDDPCPACRTTLILTDDGNGVLRFECRSCGYADTWTTGQAPADPHAEARQASQWLLAEYEQDAAVFEAKLNGRRLDDAQYQRFKRILSPGPMFTLREG